MSKIKIPRIDHTTTSSSFFTDLVALNKAANRHFSHRYLAQRLKWPVSYVSDVMRERKAFSVTRAVEFAKFAKLDVMDTEKLIFLALTENSKEDVKEYFISKLTKRTSKDAKVLNMTTTSERELFTSIKVGAIFEVLKWARRPLAAAQIRDLLFTFWDLTEAEILQAIALLQKHRMISIQGKELKILQPQITLDEFNDGTDGGIRMHKQYAENFARYAEKPIFPALFTSGFVELPKDKFNEVARKLLEVRNSLLGFAEDTSRVSKEKLEDTMVYQFDINLVLLINKNIVPQIG